MEVFAFLIAAGVIAAVAAAVQGRKTTHEAWRIAASRLGLPFTPPGLFEHPSIHGTVDECRVSVDTRTGGGDGGTTFTRYRVRYPQHLGFQMQLRRAGALSAIKALLGVEDIRVGTQAFDDRVVVQGSNPEGIRALLVPAVQTKILRFLDTCTGAEIGDELIQCESRGTEKDAGALTITVRRMVDLALTLAPGDHARRRLPERVREEASRTERRGPPPPREPPRLEPAKPRATRRAPRDRPPPAPSKPVESPRPPAATTGTRAGAATSTPRRAPPPSRPEVRASAPPPAAAPPQPSPLEADGPTVAETCRRLFQSGVASYEMDRIFDAEFRGRRVAWSGTLRWVARYPFDRVFGQEHGARATMDIHLLESGFGERAIQAVVQVAPEDEPRLRRLAGEALTLEGVLRACDGFRRQIYVERGVVGKEFRAER